MDNFSVLAERLLNLNGDPKPPLWMDIYALQLMFAVHQRPVFIAIVYGGVLYPQEQIYRAYPQVPLLSSLTECLGLGDELPPLFTVVPIIALTPYIFGSLSFAPENITDEDLCASLVNHGSVVHEVSPQFRIQPRLSVLGGEGNEYDDTFTAGYCASHSLCVLKGTNRPAAIVLERRCPGCGEAVHIECGYLNPEAPNEVDDTTCLNCFDHFCRALSGSSDPDFFARPPPPPKPASRLHNTRSAGPSEDPATKLKKAPDPPPPVPSKKRQKILADIEERRVARLAAREAAVDKNNPDYMYPDSVVEPEKDKGKDKGKDLFEDSDSDIESEDDDSLQWHLEKDGTKKEFELQEEHLAETPVQSHIYSTDEMEAFAVEADQYLHPESARDIILAAIAMGKFLATSALNLEYPLPQGLHRATHAYSPQDLVNLACLVDRGREFEIDKSFHQDRKTMFKLRVDSYKLGMNRTLQSYLQSGRKAPPSCKLPFHVFRNWLKQYLDWFNPDLYIFLQAHADGMKVRRLRTQLASESELDYQFSGVEAYDPLMVPLPKMHKEVSTTDQFGRMGVDGKFMPYCKHAYDDMPSYSQSVQHPDYDMELTESCNPTGFELVPIARMPSTKVPAIHMQITGIRANLLQHKRGSPATIRWLGLQDGKYVSLPKEWVHLNFDEALLDEARQRAAEELSGREQKKKSPWIRLPIGDSRDDDPPLVIRHKQGVHYYYQGEHDNCLMGGLVNAIFRMTGPEDADALLKDYPSVVIHLQWDKFVRHVNHVMRDRFNVRRLKTKEHVLSLDSTYPLVVQLKSTDNSDTHAICVYLECIYDSASRFVLSKSLDSLNWCCGTYDYAHHLRIYRLEPVAAKGSVAQKEKKPRTQHNRLKGK
jgi:hypothetical protein